MIPGALSAWNEDPDARLCPRCTAVLQPGSSTCDRCGLEIEPGHPEAAAEASPVGVFEEKAVSCPPHDLERVARAEAADGWELLDTTVDDRSPGLILAHFRRPARAPATRPTPTEPATASAPEPAARSKQPAAKPAPSKRQGGTERASPAPAGRSEVPEDAEARDVEVLPRGGPVPAGGQRDTAQLVFAAVMILVTLFLVKEIGFIGLFIGFAILPGLLRKLLGLPKPGDADEGDPQETEQPARPRRRSRRRD